MENTTKPYVLPWEEKYNTHTARLVGRAITVVVTQYHPNIYDLPADSQTRANLFRGKWQVIINNLYWSIRKEVFFDSPDEAKKKAEILVKQVCEGVLKQYFSNISKGDTK